MATPFTPQKIDLSTINSGNRFEPADGVTPNAINAPLEAVRWFQYLIENTPDTSDAGKEGTPTVSITYDANGLPRFKFSYLKGATGAGRDDLYLENGIGAGSIQSHLIEDGQLKGSKAYGKYSAALNQNNEARQRNSTAFGGGTRAGLTPEEFAAKYPSGVDEHGYNYEKSNAYAFASGQETRALGRGAMTGGGYKNIVKGAYSGAFGGGSNAVSGEYGATLGGYGNTIMEEAKNSCIFNGYEQIVCSENSGSGGAFNYVAADMTHVFGLGLYVDEGHGHAKTVVGKYNDAKSYAIFQVGGGSSDESRRNILEVFENGVLQLFGTNGKILVSVREDGRMMSYTAPQAPEDFARMKELDAQRKDLYEVLSQAVGSSVTPTLDDDGVLYF